MSSTGNCNITIGVSRTNIVNHIITFNITDTNIVIKPSVTITGTVILEEHIALGGVELGEVAVLHHLLDDRADIRKQLLALALEGFVLTEPIIKEKILVVLLNILNGHIDEVGKFDVFFVHFDFPFVHDDYSISNILPFVKSWFNTEESSYPTR